MSQHHCEADYGDQRVSVQFGYDRPLKGFYLVIELVGNDTDEYVYSNLSDRSLAPYMGTPPTIDPLLAVLDRLLIKIPQSMIDGVRQDAVDNVGNKVVIYDQDGNARSPARK